MSPTKLRPAYILSIIIAILATIAAAGGLAVDGLYRDNAFVRATWLGSDLVTLFLAVPILCAALIYSSLGSLKAQMVWMGILDYMLYNYAFYLFGAAFNGLFLLYVGLVGVSIFALIFGLANLDVAEISRQFREKAPVKLIGGYFLFVAFGLTVVYVVQSIAFIVTGEVPGIVVRTGHVTNVVFALDLTLLIPWLVLGALWLMKRNPWGYIIAGAVNVKGPLYTLILTINTVLLWRAGSGGGAELPLWATLTALGLAAAALFYWNVRKS